MTTSHTISISHYYLKASFHLLFVSNHSKSNCHFHFHCMRSTHPIISKYNLHISSFICWVDLAFSRVCFWVYLKFWLDSIQFVPALSRSCSRVYTNNTNKKATYKIKSITCNTIRTINNKSNTIQSIMNQRSAMSFTPLEIQLSPCRLHLLIGLLALWGFC